MAHYAYLSAYRAEHYTKGENSDGDPPLSLEINEDEEFTRTSHRLDGVRHQYIFCIRYSPEKKVGDGAF